jgi:hypothetical protein
MNYVKISLLLFTLLFSTICFSSDSTTISIVPTFRDLPVQLNNAQYVTDIGDTIKITRVRLYLSNIELTGENGDKYIGPDSYHLVDLAKDGSLSIKLNSPIKNISQINFSIGVDSAASVSGAMNGDLDPIFGMYWAWNSGYINAKIEGVSNSCNTHKNKFEFHVGGYLSPHQTIQKVELRSISKSRIIKLKMDLNKWFSNVDLSKISSVLTPGKEAVEMSKIYKEMFSIISE